MIECGQHPAGSWRELYQGPKLLVWIIFYSTNMKVSPSAQGETPLAVVKSKSLWVRVPPVSSGSVAHPNGCKNTNQQIQNPMATHREKIQSTMSTKRTFQSRLTNNTKVWASGPHLASGICAQKLREGRAPQRQITHKKGIHRINFHTVSRIKPNRLLMKSILAYNISDGDKKILFDLDSDTFTKLSTNRIDRHNETHTEVLSQYILLLNTRHISKPYSQQILDLTTLKSLRIKLFIWEYLGEKVRQQAWEKESAETSHTHTNKTNHNMLQHTFRGVEPHPPNYANSTTDADTRIKNVLSTSHVAECKETSKAPSRNSYSNQTHFPSTILDYIDTHSPHLKVDTPS